MMDHIPVIDLTKIIIPPNGITAESSFWKEIATEFGDALHGIGFAYLVNHGIPKDKILNVYNASKKFFELPKDVKLKYRKQDFSISYNGYAQPGDEVFDPSRVHELREFFDQCGPNMIWPDEEVPELRISMDELREECNILSKVMLRVLAISLNLTDEDFFIKHHQGLYNPQVKSQLTYRTMYYPPVPEGYNLLPGAIRCAEHTDYGTITFLFQDSIGGLEVKGIDGKWISADPIEDSILINTADLLELWSGGKYPATLHRVQIPESEIRKRNSRQCITYFIYPDMATDVTPLVPVVPGSKFANIPPVNAGDYFQKRVDYTFNIKD